MKSEIEEDYHCVDLDEEKIFNEQIEIVKKSTIMAGVNMRGADSYFSFSKGKAS